MHKSKFWSNYSLKMLKYSITVCNYLFLAWKSDSFLLICFGSCFGSGFESGSKMFILDPDRIRIQPKVSDPYGYGSGSGSATLQETMSSDLSGFVLTTLSVGDLKWSKIWIRIPDTAFHVITDPIPDPASTLKGTQEWEFFWLRFWFLYCFIVSYV